MLINLIIYFEVEEEQEEQNKEGEKEEGEKMVRHLHECLAGIQKHYIVGLK